MLLGQDYKVELYLLQALHAHLQCERRKKRKRDAWTQGNRGVIRLEIAPRNCFGSPRPRRRRLWPCLRRRAPLPIPLATVRS